MIQKLQKTLLVLLVCVATNSKATIFTNTNPIAIPDNSIANLYPSNITVSGMLGTITSVNVKIKNLSHSWVHDVSIMLQAPSGESLLLQSGTSDLFLASDLTYTISDAGATHFSDVLLWLNNGTYKPTAFFWDVWAAPAPPTPPGFGTYNAPTPFGAATLGSTFGGVNPNGTWKLFVGDFAMGDVGNIAGGWELDVVTSAPLGLNLLAFSASKINQNNNQLYWQTESEINFSHFEVEHSTDNINFEKVGEIKSLNLLHELSTYSFMHNNVASSKHYYRLKIVDIDGQSFYSKTISQDNSIESNSISIFPTIVTDHIQIVSDDMLISSVKISSIHGQTMSIKNPNAQQANWQLSELGISSPGIYIISVYSDEGLQKQEKILVQ